MRQLRSESPAPPARRPSSLRKQSSFRQKGAGMAIRDMQDKYAGTVPQIGLLSQNFCCGLPNTIRVQEDAFAPHPAHVKKWKSSQNVSSASFAIS